MSVLGTCDSCGQLDNCMLYIPAKKWLCDSCWDEYERLDRPDNDRECPSCGDPDCQYHECEESERVGEA